jgi:hypothetical protein
VVIDDNLRRLVDEQSGLCREGGPHPVPPVLHVSGEVSTHVGAFDLALFAALVGDDDDDLDDLTSDRGRSASNSDR